MSVVTDATGSNVWIASEMPQVRIGLLNPTTDQYQEWRTAFSGQPQGLALNTGATGTGELWFTYASTVVRKLPGSTTPNFRTFNLGINGEAHGVAIAANGDAIVASYNGSDKGIWRIPRATAGASVTVQFWALPQSTDFPHDVRVDAGGYVWFTNRSSRGGGPDKISRLDLSTGNLLEWPLPYGTLVNGLTLLNATSGPAGAKTVCAVEGGTQTPTYVDGEALCFDVPATPASTATFRRLIGGGYNFPQQISLSSAGDVFLTEQMASALSYVTAAAVTSSSSSSILPTARALGAAVNRTATAADLTIAPQATITISGANRVDSNVTGTPDGTGRVRFTWPNANQYPHPVGLSSVIGLPGVAYVAEYFRGYGDAVAGRITRFTLNTPTPPVILLNGTKTPVVPALSFNSTIGDSAPAAQDVAVEEEGSLPLSWSATSNQSWLSAVAVDNDTVTPSTLRVSVTPPTVAGNYTGTITVTGADGAASRTVDVTLVVAAQPTMQVTGSSLLPAPGYVGKLVFTAVAGFDLLPTPILPTAQTLMIANTGGGNLAWTTAVTGSAGSSIAANTLTLTPPSGSQLPNVPATALLVSITPGNVPGTLGLYTGVLTVSSSNATNTQQIKIELNVVDHGLPTLHLPAPLTVEAENNSGAHAAFAVTATDVLGRALTPVCRLGAGTSGPVVASGAMFALGLTTVTCEANDGLGSATTGSFAVTVADTTGPVFAAIADRIAEATGPNPNAAAVTYALPVATDAVDGVRPVSCSPASGSNFTLGNTLVTCTSSDTTGHSSSASFTVKVLDTTPPVIAAMPANISNVEATTANGAVVTFALPKATDLVDGAVPVMCSPAAGATFALGTTTVTCSATDTSGKDARATFTITVVDTTPPVLSPMPPSQTLEANMVGGVSSATYTLPTALDIVAGVRPVSCSPASGSFFAMGANTVTCSTNDGRGNTRSNTFLINVVDTVAPVLTLPNITVNAITQAGANVSFSGATAVDLVTGSRPLTCTPASGSLFAIGTQTVNCSASDVAGNIARGSFTVTVQGDSIAPVLSLPAADLTAEVAALVPGTVVTYAASANDPDHGAVAIICSPASGAAFPFGTTTVQCSATDASNNTTTGSFKVVVRDTKAPVLTLSNVTADATGASGASVTYSGSATDLGQPVAVVCNGQAVPVTATFPVGTATVSCTANDGRGNIATDSMTVTVSALNQFVVAPRQLAFAASRWTTCNGSTRGSTPASQSLVLTNSTRTTMWYLAVAAQTGGAWLSVSPTRYYVPAGGTRSITVSVDPEGLDDRTYNATITIYTLQSSGSNPYQPDVDKQTVPVTFNVTPAEPRLCVTPTSWNFGTVSQNAASASKLISVTNAGDGSLPQVTFTNLGASAGSVQVAPAQGGARVHVFTTASKGSKTGSLVVRAGSQTQTISLAWTVGKSKGSGHDHDDRDDDDCHGDHDGDGTHDSNDHHRHRRGWDRD